MVKRMMIDASHPEETRVVVLNGTRIDEYDYETTSKKQLKGNIYLAKITRVEPSLQAAFVEYGGNRHGFLPFSEIHPDYYRIPIADREALIAEERAVKSEDEEPEVQEDAADEKEPVEVLPAEQQPEAPETSAEEADNEEAAAEGIESEAAEVAAALNAEPGTPEEEIQEIDSETNVDTVGGDDVDDAARRRAKLMRRYKIQEVIKRRQVILVQVSKEERGNKGAALTTYLSLAGRYCVLMPNTNKGGGISRKISSANDRRRLRKITGELKIPEGMAVIVRTAGSQRSKAEIRRDYEYLLRLWSEIRENTLQSQAPSLIYEEANLIKRAIRDLYTRDMEDILVEGEEGHKAAKNFMKSLMPSHARKVQLYKDENISLFQRHQVETQLDAMYSNSVQLRSGGYIVLSATEALVAIDVNSGKATRERHIEETALKTNLEAAEEVGRQLRLRDLAGLIVIDFIDMEEPRHNREVERRLKEALKHDRARIQLGRISPFGLLEMSRQRLRPSLFESSTKICPTCGGSGHSRTTEFSALHVLRILEDEAIRRGAGEVRLVVPTPVALYVLNQKRDRLLEIEQRNSLKVSVETDDGLVASDFELERISGQAEEDSGERRKGEGRRRETVDEERRSSRSRRGRRRKAEEAPAAQEADTDEEERTNESGVAIAAADSEESETPKKRRRRGKRGGRRRSRKRQEDGPQAAEGEEVSASQESSDAGDEIIQDAQESPIGEEDTSSTSGESKGAKASSRRRRRTRRTKDSAQDSEISVESASQEDAATETASSVDDAGEEQKDAAEAPKRKPRTRSRRKPSRPKAEESPDKRDTPEAPLAAAPSALKEPQPKAASSNGGSAPAREREPAVDRPPAELPLPAAAAQAEAISISEAPVAASDGPTQSPEQRQKKRGWWSRIISTD